MQKIPFLKMNGSGNDFIIIDNRAELWNHVINPEFVRAVCTRKISVGADGLIFIEKSDQCDFLWRFFNSDGSQAEMCGNGGRCAAYFAVLQGFADHQLSFETMAGIIHAEVEGSRVKIQLSQPENMQMDIPIEIDGEALSLHSINTGVPHVIHFVEDIENVPVKRTGEKIRFHHRFQPAGTNVNFVAHGNKNMLHIRTYERGVEDETYACGTGVVAAALIALSMGKVNAPVEVMTRSREVLRVHTREFMPPFKAVYLEGGVRVVCAGEIWEDAYKKF
jgi:diaminopimelate epimerase